MGRCVMETVIINTHFHHRSFQIRKTLDKKDNYLNQHSCMCDVIVYELQFNVTKS